MPLLRVDDLTEEALTKVFREYFNLKTLSISIEEQAREFTGVNDQFQSEIKKLAVKIKKDDKEEEISMVVKTTPKTSFQRIIQRLTRPFLSEVMWYSQVQAWKRKIGDKQLFWFNVLIIKFSCFKHIFGKISVDNSSSLFHVL